MMNDITRFFMTTASNKIMEIVVICIVMDTIFGVLRAIKEKSSILTLESMEQSEKSVC